MSESECLIFKDLQNEITIKLSEILLMITGLDDDIY